MSSVHQSGGRCFDGAGDRDDVVKFWDIRKVQGPAATVQAPQQVCSSSCLVPRGALPCGWQFCHYVQQQLLIL